MTAHIPAITRLSSRIIRVLGCNPSMMTLQGTNTYIIGTGKRRILLDAGDSCIEEYQTNLKEILRKKNAQIDNIVITHWHHDHVGGVLDIQKFIGQCKVNKMPRLDGAETENIPFAFVKNGDTITTEGATLRVHYTPGHTTDHIVLSMDEEECLFSGDCILGEGTTVFEDLYDYMNSLKTILNLSPKIIYPGHGPVIEDPTPKIQYYIDHRMQREENILDEMSKNPTASFDIMELVRIIYDTTPEHLHPAAAMNVNHHLTKLKKEGVVLNISDKWSLTTRKAQL